jgi:hypothetical protein
MFDRKEKNNFALKLLRDNFLLMEDICHEKIIIIIKRWPFLEASTKTHLVFGQW